MMRLPVATYRVQFNSEFRFRDALDIVPHLHRLGISHLYASPIWAARAESTHGYDVIDPNRLNPVLGTPEDFDALVDALRSRGMGLIVDIVPNHMAAHPGNAWWVDVLENGALSPYANYFGINWGAVRQSHGEKIFLPLLGAPYGAALENGEIQLVYKDGAFFVAYYERLLPVAVRTYSEILRPQADRLSDLEEFRLLLAAIERLPAKANDVHAREDLYREQSDIKRNLAKLYSNEPRVREHVESNLQLINGTPGDGATFDLLDELLQQQSYRLAYWLVATERTNYRRFFDVADLIGMRIEDTEVFRASHSLIFDLVRKGSVEGLRIDHIDGLADPQGYIDRLPVDSTYVVAEKILVGDERLPRDWKLHGTTGYDFLGYMNALFVNEPGLEQIGRFYTEHTGVTATLTDIEYRRKLLVINSLFAGEMADLGANLERLAEEDRYARDLSPRDLSRGLQEVTACMPVYRTYTRTFEVSDRDRPYLQSAVNEARRRCPDVSSFAYDFIGRVLQLQFHRAMSAESRKNWLRFVRRWQQLSGPIMAKGVEDSTFYVYNRLVSLNEVGGLSRPATPEEFHAFLAERRQLWPATMNASSTHDTKRSEDVRARINVLSEIPGEWTRSVARWSRWVAAHRRSVDLNEEYFYFQNVLGAWPLCPDEAESFRERLKKYSTKAAREAREHTNWLSPNVEHERDLHGFIDSLFADERFLSSFLAFQQKTAFYGAVNSLSQVLLKTTAPGCPDFYRGTIGWDFSLVDPDNRRPVAFPSLTDFDEPARSLLPHWHDGRVKVFLTERVLAFRKANVELFEGGDYIPLQAEGKRASHVFAFGRRAGDQWAIVVVPRLVSQLSTVLRFPTGITAWRDTHLMLPGDAPPRWKNVLTGGRLTSRDSALPVYRVLEQFPVGLLVSK